MYTILAILKPLRAPQYWAALALHTRTYGHCYVHARKRAPGGIVGIYEGIVFFHGSYGRSLQAGGHKFKVHARYEGTGKPVPSEVLRGIISIK